MDLLKKMKYVGLCAGIVAFAFSATIGNAANPQDTTVTIVVDNSVTVTKTDDMNFGKVVAVSNATGTAAIVVDTAGAVTGFSATPGGARFISLDNTNWSEMGYTVAAANDAVLSVTYGNTSGTAVVTLTCTVGCTGTPPTFTLDTYTHAATVGSVGTVTAGASTVTVTNAGAATVAVGGTLHTTASASPYQSGTYTGTLRVTVSY